MFIAFSILAYGAFVGALFHYFPRMRQPILNYAQALGLNIAATAMNAWRFIWVGTLIGITGLVGYGLLLMFAVLIGHQWLTFGVLMFGIILFFPVMYAMYLLRFPLTIASEKLLKAGGGMWNLIPAILSPEASSPSAPGSTVTAISTTEGTTLNVHLILREILNLFRDILLGLINAPYMLFSLPLKGIGGSIWIIGYLIERAEGVARWISRFLAGIVTTLLFLASLILVCQEFHLEFMGNRYIWFLMILLGILAITGSICLADVATVNRSSGKPWGVRMMGTFAAIAIGIVIFAQIDPRIARSAFQNLSNAHNWLAKTSIISSVTGQTTENLYVQARTDIPVLYERHEDGGDTITWTILPGAKDSKGQPAIKAGKLGVLVDPNADPETRGTRLAMVHVVWVDSEDALPLVDTALAQDPSLAVWVPKDYLIFLQAPPSPSAPTLVTEGNKTPAASVKPVSRTSGDLDLDMMNKYMEFVNKYQAQYPNLSVPLIAAVIQQESGWNPNAESSKGAIGLMGLMPETARRLGVDPRDPEQNIRGGIQYLAEQLEKFGNTDLALAAYNWGPEHIGKHLSQSWDKISPIAPEETRDYVSAVIALARTQRFGRHQIPTRQTTVVAARQYTSEESPAAEIDSPFKSPPLDPARTQAVNIALENKRNEAVYIYRVNSDGKELLCSRPALPAGMQWNQPTFAGQIWVARDRNGLVILKYTAQPDDTFRYIT